MTSPPRTEPDGAPGLSPALQRWLQARQPVRFGPERDYGPFVFQQPDGRLDGLSVDMLRLVQARTGLQVRELPAAPLRELLAAARTRQVDLLSSLRPTPERAEYLRFSQPYVSVPALLVRRADDAVVGLAQLAGVAVAVGDGYAVEAPMRQRHPAVRWVPMADDGLALTALLQGAVQAVVVDAASLAFLVRSRGLGGLRADGPVGFEYTLSFGVRADWPELVEVINRGIQLIGKQERQRVLDRWLTPLPALAEAATGSWAVRWGGALALLPVLTLGGLWLRRRRLRAQKRPPDTGDRLG
ncbi:transporter substrate-binding domain-containing protein [Ideonella sp. DXS22W]|uniref:Transporter substrate-binding domain-containing protein n=1 Tax=Pseudaquabacterium inlustre TaxID=2984192 RepID=A0ABU9CN82_9BURK